MPDITKAAKDTSPNCSFAGSVDFTRDIDPECYIDQAIDDYKGPEVNFLVNGELVKGKLLKTLNEMD